MRIWKINFILFFFFLKIRFIVNQAVEVPECMNDLRKQQLKELAIINGTLRENDSLK